MASRTVVNPRVAAINESATLALTAKANAMKAAGEDVIAFAAGEPDFDTPEFIKEAAVKALKAGKTKYAPVAGTPELRQAIVDKLKNENGLVYEPGEIVVSCGAKHSLFNAVLTLVCPGDEVLIPAPYWVTYPEQVRLAGGTPVYVPTEASDAFKLRAGAVRPLVKKGRTKLIILNSPNNPTGAVYDEKDLREIAEIALANDLYVISDEIYEHLIYGGKKHVSIFALNGELKKRGILVNGLSKAYAMTGWRIGYTAAPKEFTTPMSRLQSHSTSGITTFCMPAAVAALKSDGADVRRMRAAFETRRNLIIKRAKAIAGLECTEPEGAFYLMVGIGKIIGKTVGGRKITGAADFCMALLETKKVAAVSGEDFGAPHWLRFSYACSEDTINKGFDRIAEFMKDVK
jgi:aspartate aminotransferase